MPLDHIPPIYGRLTIGYDNGKWQAEAYTNFNFSKSYSRYNLNGEDNQNYAPAGGVNGMPAWVLLGIRASYNVNKNFMLQLAADNLLDTAYRTFASGMNSAGRNLMATARFKF
jgi:hemoglobin/transferrin/lactoferrin receptor protein